MSNIDHIIEERSTQIGDFLVGRLLPFRSKRMVGPFIFIDHMGPASMKLDSPLSIGAHPHIGLSTLTYLLEGAILHKDGLGTNQIITPGAVNWMTAGSGIAHSEHSIPELSDTLHGLQIWVALPSDKEEMDPEFFHCEASSLPTFDIESVQAKLIAGKFGTHISPVPVFSEMYFVELKNEGKAKTIDLSPFLFGECGIYILSGEIEIDENQFTNKQLLVTEKTELCKLTLSENSLVYIFGGTPFPEERHIYWNFVSTSKERIEKAKEDWTNRKFKSVPNETEWIPLPEIKKP